MLVGSCFSCCRYVISYGYTILLQGCTVPKKNGKKENVVNCHREPQTLRSFCVQCIEYTHIRAHKDPLCCVCGNIIMHIVCIVLYVRHASISELYSQFREDLPLQAYRLVRAVRESSAGKYSTDTDSQQIYTLLAGVERKTSP